MSLPAKAVIFGATGMVGSEVLDICLRSHEIESVTTVGRRKTGLQQAKHLDMTKSAKAFAPIYRLFPAIGVDTSVLARAIVEVGIKGHEKTILENSDLRAFGN